MTVYAVADLVGVVDDGDSVFVARLPDGPILGLTGTAALVWRAALAGSADGIVDRVATDIGHVPAAIEADVDAFVESLVAERLLVPVPAEGY